MVRWHAAAFRFYWRWRSWREDGWSARGDYGALIRDISRNFPDSEAVRIRRRLQGLDVEVPQSTVKKHLAKFRSQAH